MRSNLWINRPNQKFAAVLMSAILFCISFPSNGNINLSDFTCPPRLEVQCFDKVPAPHTTLTQFLAAGGTAVNVDPATFTWVEDIRGMNTCPETLTRRYSVTTTSGVVLYCDQAIIINDTTPPVYYTPLPTITVSGSQRPSVFENAAELIVAAGFTDNCALDMNFISSSYTYTTQRCSEERIYTYIIRDLCGNTTTITQKIIINQAPPVVASQPGPRTNCTLPPLYTLESWIAAGGSLWFYDNVSMTYVPLSQIITGDDCNGTVTRKYRFTNGCEQTEWTETIYLRDVQNPAFTKAPNPVITNCVVPVPYTSYAQFTATGGLATDDCALNEGSFRFVPGSEVVLNASCPRILRRTYEIADKCGKLATVYDTLTIEDTTPPVVSCPPDITGRIYPDIPAPYTLDEFLIAGGVTLDNCDIKTFSWTTIDSLRVGTVITVLREYRVEDFCGLSSVCVHRITATFQGQVLLACPPPRPSEVDCYSSLPPPLTWEQFKANGGSAYSSFGIDSTTFQMIDQTPVQALCHYDVIRRYSILDSLGQEGICQQVIRIQDRISPIVSCPPTIIVLPGQPVPNPYGSYNTFVNAGGTVWDNCQVRTTGAPLIRTITRTGCDADTIFRTYRFSDLCNNQDTCVQLVILRKNYFEFRCPGDVVAECMTDMPSPFTTLQEFRAAGGVASNNCGLDESSFSHTQRTISASCPLVIERTYKVKSNKGEEHTCTQRITIHDKTRPVISPVPPLTIACSDNTLTDRITQWLNGITATDNCGLKSFTNNFNVNQLTYSGTQTIDVVFTAIDDCNNTQTATGRITITYPVEVKTTLSVAPLAVCEGESVTLTAVSENAGPNPVYTWFVNGTTVSGVNSSTYTYKPKDGDEIYVVLTSNVACTVDPKANSNKIKIIVNENLVVSVSLAVDQDRVCEGTPVTFTATPVNGGANPQYEWYVNGSKVTNATGSVFQYLPQNGDNIVVRLVSDGLCINNHEAVSNTIIMKAVSPKTTFDNCPANPLIVPADAERCSAEVTLPELIYNDLCDAGLSLKIPSSKRNFEVGKHTVNIEHKAGETLLLCLFEVIVTDSQPPKITCDPQIIIEADAGLCSANYLLPPPVIIDNCTGQMTYTHQRSDSLGQYDPYQVGTTTIVRTVNDNINTSSCQTVLTVIDNEPPVFESISPLLIDCSSGKQEDLIAAWLQSVKATDNCGSSYVKNDFNNNDAVCGKTITVTFTAVDENGNTNETSSSITIKDDIPPVFLAINPLVLECSSPDSNRQIQEWLSSVKANDICSSVTISNDYKTINNQCGNPNEVTFTAVDGCGNKAEVKQSIIIDDNNDPNLKCPLDSVVKGWNQLPEPFKALDGFLAAGGKAIDNCGIAPSSFTLISEIVDTAMTQKSVRRAYYIEDKCRNSDVCVHKIIIEDTGTSAQDLSDNVTFHLQLYPNPNRGIFNYQIELDKMTDVSIEVIDFAGKVIYTSAKSFPPGISTERLGLDNLIRGTYLLKASDGQRTVVEKFVVE